jgi:ubiquinone/menaquinone biosynthesis C-methylase UbiE
MNNIPPHVYELAFSYRDYGADCDCIEYNWQKHTRSENVAVLDIGCGTSPHLRQFASRGYHCTGIDLNGDMLQYARQTAEKMGLTADFVEADMIDFRLDGRFGLAFNLLTSANLILTNDQMISHLRSVARVLDPGGIYFLEMNHPREYGVIAEYPARAWEINRDDLTINADIAYDQDRIDPLRQTQAMTLNIDVMQGENEERYSVRRAYRVYHFLEFQALVRLAGGFEPVICYGAFNSSIILDNSRRSWRMIPVLRRTADPVE